MRVLALTPELPFAPGGTGGSTRQFHLLKALVDAGHDVRCVAPVHPSQDEGAARLQAAGVELHGVQRPPSRLREAAAAVARRPALAVRALADPVVAWQVEVFWASLRGRAARALAGWSPDVITVEHDWAARWSRDLPPAVPKLLTLENLSWAYYESRAAASGGARAGALRLEARRFARFDARHLASYDLLVAVSEQDRRDVRAVASVPCEVVPNGVDTSTFAVARDPGEPTCIFTGTLGYAPNAEGARWLLSEIWPRVTAEVPDARLLVVGPDPPDDVCAFAGPEVEVTGWVRSVPEWMARAAVALVPIRSGGGTRLKVLDALASGRAVVSTRVGAGGIEIAEGRDAVLVEDAGAFAAAVVRLLRDEPERARLAAAGRRLAVERYDWKVLGARFEAVVSELAT
jgi:polysaccharide biosynthesis protein PslH